MKKIIKIAILILAMNYQSLLNAEVPHFLDFKYILNQSEAGKKAQQTLKNKLDNGIKKLKVKEKNLQEEEKKIVAQKKIISAEEYKKKVNGLRNKVSSLQKERNDLLNNIAKQTNYNGTTLLQASAGSNAATASLTFQMGETSSDTIASTGSVQSNTSGLALSALKTEVATTGGLSALGARNLLDDVDTALNTLNGWRADFGSTQNQLESAVRNQMTQQTNIKAAESVIRDVDYAQESANFNKQNIIAQAGTYAMSQANAAQQNVTRLLQ